MAERRFLLVDSEVLPDVFLKVLEAKQLLASGTVSPPGRDLPQLVL